MPDSTSWQDRVAARQALWAEVAALDDAALNLAIAEQCSYVLDDRSRYPVTSWPITMALSRRYAVWSRPFLVGWLPHTGNRYEGWEVSCDDLEEVVQEDYLLVHTEHEERVARCRLALWRAQIEKERPDAS